MKHSLIAITALAVLSCVLISGCTSDNEAAPAATPVLTPDLTFPPTTAAPATTTVAVATTTANPDNGPIQVMPTAQQINLELTKDRPTSKISLLYQGGPGEMFTQKISLHMYGTDGTYVESVMNDGKKPIPGNEIIVQGTRDGDRCVVYVQSAGTTYKVMDEQVFAARI
ncbi:MAG: hypothetical protein M0R30_13785 [Methanoregula sp.]|jgi:hypothetical protein|uniref:hypothetical protein n=1 Tax=Methanoregula sp. TaxID=2052170 RepID=UPI0025E8D9FF|nr:hypothetical protein [Methanoregula sp.]MCK9632697.1 hypothetical protein [Methanoregula sp.]